MQKTNSFSPQAFGQYVLLDRIAVGGMAEIFKAKQTGARGFEKLIVIKKILHHLSEDPEFVEMFEDEAKIAAQLNHANIVQIYELGEFEETLYIAMELVEGRNLRDVTRAIASKGMHLSIDQSVFIVANALRGLDYAHRKKTFEGKEMEIIHRDISPQNIVASYEGEIKILDFGIAKAASKISRTEAGVLKGKFSYMSPEQASGREIDQSTDVYALGVIFYELLTSDRLFKAETDIETLERVKIGNVPAPSEKNPNVPSELDRIVLKALARNPSKRYRSAGELLADLNRFSFEQGMTTSAQDLAVFMRTLFQESIAAERERLTEALAKLPEVLGSTPHQAETNVTFKASSPLETSKPKRVVEVTRTENTHTGYRPPARSRLLRQSLLGVLFLAALAWVVLLSLQPTDLPLPVDPAPSSERASEQSSESEEPGPSPARVELEPMEEIDPGERDEASLQDFFGEIDPIDEPQEVVEETRREPTTPQFGTIKVLPPHLSIVDFYINDQLIGTAPGPKARGLQLRAGTHHLRCVRGHDPSRSYHIEFTLDPNQNLELFCDRGELRD